MAWLNELKRKNPQTGKTDTYYQIQWRSNPTDRKKISSLALGFISREEANRALRKMEDKIEGAEIVVGPAKTSNGCSDEITLETWIDSRAIPSIEARSGEGSTLTLAIHLCKALKRHLGTLRLSKISSADADAYILARRKEDVRSETIRKELLLLRRALKLAQREGKLKQAPEIELPRNIDKKPLKFLSPEDSEKVVEALETTSPKSALAIWLGLALGMRASEVLKLRWEDINWPDRTILIRRKEINSEVWSPKTGTTRTVSLTTVEVLMKEAWLRDGRPVSGWIFPSKANPEQPQKSFRKALKNACQRANVQPIHPHALRHSFATRLLAAGVDMKTVMEIGGWKRVDTLQEVYAHSTKKHQKNALEVTALGRMIRAV